MQKFKRFAISFGLILFLLAGAVGAYFYFGNYSDGYRVGVLQKLSKKGVVFKTWEGELSQAFLEQSAGEANGIATRMFLFSVRGDDKATISALERAMEHGNRVKLHYNEKFYRYFWVGETKYLVDQVEEVANGSALPTPTPTPTAVPTKN